MKFTLTFLATLLAYSTALPAQIFSPNTVNKKEIRYVNGEGSFEFYEFVNEICNSSEFHCYPINPTRPDFGDAFVKYRAINDETNTIITLSNSGFDEAVAIYNSVGSPFRGLNSLVYLSNKSSKEIDEQITKAERLEDACETASQACMLVATIAMAKRDALGFIAFVVCSYSGNSCETRMANYIGNLRKEKEEKEKKEAESPPPPPPPPPPPSRPNGGHGGREGGPSSSGGNIGGGARPTRELPEGHTEITDFPDSGTGAGCSHWSCKPP